MHFSWKSRGHWIERAPELGSPEAETKEIWLVINSKDFVSDDTTIGVYASSPAHSLWDKPRQTDAIPHRSKTSPDRRRCEKPDAAFAAHASSLERSCRAAQCGALFPQRSQRRVSTHGRARL